MANFGDVERCAKQYEQLLQSFTDWRDSIESERLDEGTTPWFAVEQTDRPWVFYVTWLGRKYCLRLDVPVTERHDSWDCPTGNIEAYGFDEMQIPPQLAPLLNSGELKGKYVTVGNADSFDNPFLIASESGKLLLTLIGHPLAAV